LYYSIIEIISLEEDKQSALIKLFVDVRNIFYMPVAASSVRAASRFHQVAGRKAGIWDPRVLCCGIENVSVFISMKYS